MPEALARLVSKALRKQPAERYQTGRQMAQDLEYVIQSLAPQEAGLQAPAVVYDAGRTPTGQNMMDLEKTVLEYPAQRTPA
jgi:serine/threonine-protein kinase